MKMKLGLDQRELERAETQEEAFLREREINEDGIRQKWQI